MQLDPENRAAKLNQMNFGALKFFCDVYELLDQPKTSKTLRKELADKKYVFAAGRVVVNKIKILEDNFGGRTLFNRDQSEGFTERTEFADTLYSLIRPFLANFHIKTGLEDTVPRPTLVVAVSPTILEFVLPPVLERFFSEFKGRVDIRYEEVWAEDTATNLRRGATHLALDWDQGIINFEPEACESLHDHAIPPVLAVPASMERRLPNPASLSSIEDCTVLYPEHPAIQREIAKLKRAAPKVHFVQATTTRVILEHVRLGSVLGIVPDLPWVLEPYTRRSDIELRSLDGEFNLPMVLPAIFRGRQRPILREEANEIDVAEEFVKEYKKAWAALPKRDAWNAFCQEHPLPFTRFERVPAWHVYYVSCPKETARGATWFEGRLEDFKVGRDEEKASRNPALAEHFFEATLTDFKLPGHKPPVTHYDVEGVFAVLADKHSRSRRQQFALMLRGDERLPAVESQPARDQRGSTSPASADYQLPWTAMFCVAVSLREAPDKECLLGSWSSQDGKGRPTTGTMILAEAALSQENLRQLADHAYVRFLPTSHRHAEVIVESPERR